MTSTISADTIKESDWQSRLDDIIEMMREMSLHTDPQTMVRIYGERVRKLNPNDGYLAISRRNLEAPQYRVTRFSGWQHEVNPWKETHKLPLLSGGLLGELIYSDKPRLIQDLELDPADPAFPYLEGQGSILAIPHFDMGRSLNMVVLMRREPNGFDVNLVPEIVWTSNLFGRSTHSLTLADQLRKSNEALERELQIVADIQRSLLPNRLPHIPHLDLAANYKTSRHAGGDYYDLFPLPDGRWGILIADVSGHGTPAAVLMAITHSLAHAYPGPPSPPGRMLDHINDCLAEKYTSDSETFVTAFYGIFDPEKRTLSYSSAGHNPPRMRPCGDATVVSLDGARNLPLGILSDREYGEETIQLSPGDQLIFYTDGITEAVNASGKMYGLDRLDSVLENCHGDAAELILAVLGDLEVFVEGVPAGDDQTLLVAKVS